MTNGVVVAGGTVDVTSGVADKGVSRVTQERKDSQTTVDGEEIKSKMFVMEMMMMMNERKREGKQ